MAETISPVVHGGNRMRYARLVAVHTSAAGAAAAVVGGALGALGQAAQWSGRPALIALAGIALLCAARDLLRIPIPLPALRRQVPEWWRTFFSPSVAAGLYGAGLGVGFLTHLYYATLVAVAAGALLTSDPGRGALIYGTFGLSRGLSLVEVAWARRHDQLQDAVDALARRSGTASWRSLNAAASLAVAVAAASVAF